MSKDLSVVLLLDYYGGLLPEKQRRLVEYYYCDDLSLSEITDNENITRQGARDAIVRAVSKLRKFEESVGFIAKVSSVKELLSKYSGSKEEKDFELLSQAIKNM